MSRATNKNISGWFIREEAVHEGEWSDLKWVTPEDYRGLVWQRPWRVGGRFAMKHRRAVLRQLREAGIAVPRGLWKRRLGGRIASPAYVEEPGGYTSRTRGLPDRQLGRPIWQHMALASPPVRAVEGVGWGLVGVWVGTMALWPVLMWIGIAA